MPDEYWYKLFLFHNPFFDSLLIDRGILANETFSPVSYENSGQIGDQIFKIQWMNAGFIIDYISYSWNNPTYNDSISFQIWLYEKTGDIEIHFGPSQVDNPFSYYTGDGITGYSGSVQRFVIGVSGDSTISIY